MAGGTKRRGRTSDVSDLLSLRVDRKIAQAFRDEAYKLKTPQYALFEKLWRVYVEKRNVAP